MTGPAPMLGAFAADGNVTIADNQTGIISWFPADTSRPGSADADLAAHGYRVTGPWVPAGPGWLAPVEVA